MILKLLVVGFVVIFVGKLFFVRRFGELKLWADRFANAFLVAIAIWLAIQLAVVAL